MKKWIWAAAAVLLAWNLWLTVTLNQLRNDRQSDTSYVQDGDPSVVDHTIEEFTTDLTTLAENARAKVVTVSAVTDSGEHIVSGVVSAVIGNDVWILSTCRIIAEAARYAVRFDNGLSVSAELYGSDPLTDVALYLTHPDFEVTPITVGSSYALKQGEYVVALGGRNLHTQTGEIGFGIVSLPGQFYRSSQEDGKEWITGGITTDIPLTENCIGAPLLNLAGQMVGILSSSLSESRTGMSTAVSANEMMLAAEEIRREGEVTRGYLGIVTKDASTLELYQKAAMNISLDVTSGVVIVEVIEDSPAAEAGLQANDVITDVGESGLTGSQALEQLLYSHVPGDTLSLTVHRQGSSNPVAVTLR